MKELQGPVPTRTSSPSGCIKITMFLRKLPGVSDDYFHAYWANNHVAPALRNPVFRHNVKKYNQYHITPEMRAQTKALGAPVLDYDGVAEIWVDSIEDWVKAVTEPSLSAELKDDHTNFMAQPVHVMVGFDHLIHKAKL